ncbi:hypothetical protein ETC03_17785 [Geobacillus sp. MMMUD3]|nr:hypothetical protein [Geobacillus sp. MMMUD3]
MNDKERLRKIKNTVFNQIDDFLSMGEICDDVFLEVGDVNWLISQAEKVGRLEQDIERLKKENKTHASVVTDYAIEKMNLQQQLRQAQAKIERCKEIFKDIRDASSDIYALRKAEQALQALEGEE